VHHLHPNGYGESLAHVTFEYPHTTAVIDIAWKNGGFAQGSALLLGDRGEAFYEGSMTRGATAHFRVADSKRTLVDEARETVDDYAESFYLLQRDFIGAVQAEKPGPQPASENLQTLEMIFAAYAAAEQMQPVHYPTFVETVRSSFP
jgi:predicted dehydrogenase